MSFTTAIRSWDQPHKQKEESVEPTFDEKVEALLAYLEVTRDELERRASRQEMSFEKYVEYEYRFQEPFMDQVCSIKPAQEEQ